jgi:hypothetical protein
MMWRIFRNQKSRGSITTPATHPTTFTPQNHHSKTTRFANPPRKTPVKPRFPHAVQPQNIF